MKRMSIVWLAACLLVGSALAGETAAAQPALRIAAAADLQPVLPPILAEFQHATGIAAEATYQASAALTVQIQNGAPFDVFLSADLGYPQRLIDAHLADGGTGADASHPVVYARGTLVLWTRKDARLPAPSLALLKDSRLQRLAIANPERAPYGRAAVAALNQLGIYEAIKPRIVTAENISQAAQFVFSGNAQAGLISLTSARTAQMSSAGSYFILPRDLYPPIEQGAVLLTRSTQRPAAQRFLDYLLSAPVQAELARSGLTPVK